MGGTEQDYVNDAFETNWIAPLGPHVNAFEQELSAYANGRYAAALSSGTAAIHLALILLGVQQGDEVLCQSMTFSASANPIVYQGAEPVFIDSEPQTWNMDPNLLEEAIQQRIVKGKMPKAIIPVHLYGMPADMSSIMEISKRYDIPVIEDAAEALGSKLEDQYCGSFGELGVFSFNGNKIITTSGGGALLSSDQAYVEKARFLATQARDQAPHYQHSQIGYNYRMSNVCAGIGRGQLEVLDHHIAARRSNFEYYQQKLGHLPAISFLPEPSGYFSNRWLTTILVEPLKTKGVNREDIRLALEIENIEARPLWKPMHLQPVFESYESFENGTSEALFEKGLCLPSGSNLSDEHLDRVVRVVKKVFKSS